MRFGLALSLVLLLVSPSAAERARRALSEEAVAHECRVVEWTDEWCITVQVLRSKLSDGLEQTTLFFSATKNQAEIPVFPTSFFTIDNQQFVMDRDGTRAILSFRLPPPEGQPEESQPAITVIWDATDDFSARRFSTEVVREKTAEGITKSRVIERERERSAHAEGLVGPLPLPVPVPEPLPAPSSQSTPEYLTFNTATVGEGGFASALLMITRTIERTQLLEEEPDFPDPAE